jgi:hypothetical protein
VSATIVPPKPATIAVEPILVVADILKSEMGLEDGQVMLAYEKFDIDPDGGLYIALSYLGPGQVIGSVNRAVPTADGMDEQQSAAILHTIQIDLMSFDSSARLRHPEVALAIGSIYAEQQMEANNLQIARQPTPFIDASSAEPTKILNRFVTDVRVSALWSKTKAAPYYTDFSRAVPPQLKTDPEA